MRRPLTAMIIGIGLITMTACQNGQNDKATMTTEQKEIYAYNEGAVTALEQHLLKAISLHADQFDPAEDPDFQALISETRDYSTRYTDALVDIQSSLADGSCKTAQAAYLKLEQKELGLISDMLDAMEDGNGAGAKAKANEYVALTSASESQAVDSAYKEACGVSMI